MPDSGEVHIVGTVHTSPQTKTRVLTAIENVDPDVVAVELGVPRFEAEFSDGGAGVAPNLSLGAKALYKTLAYQQKLQMWLAGLDEDGADLIPAVKKAFQNNTPVALIDSPIDRSIEDLTDSILSVDTLKMVLRSALDDEDGLPGERGEALDRFFELFEENNIPTGLLSPSSAMEEIPLEVLGEMDACLKVAFPEQYDILIGKRNRDMAGYLHELKASGYTVVAIMGRLHVPGVYKYLDEPDLISRNHVSNPPIRVADDVDGL